ncbi:hypothetical protein NKH89_13505 [Mesorhizobium sp. M0923]|uniref:hypothetical protein n=1 Tax=unclassified Mesorhizobium TaxID=325217 RepID=UPI0003D0415A|nr:hypothetical protein [Mesorhizobium sp. L48C026A00]ESZ03719.1 hypothetical protein X737_37400 [Mesorhizobium sp. L48C026A00]
MTTKGNKLLKAGNVVDFPYLWKWQAELGEVDGRKDRPICVLFAALNLRDGLTHLALIAISSEPPRHGQQAIEIPETECRRARLADWKQGWVTISEYNYDIAEKSCCFDTNQEPIGRFGKRFMQRLATAAAPLFRQGGAKVDRR